MEVREILIANTKTQKRSKVTTDATTLGELKVALDNAGVDYSGMTFTEGISKTQLLDDATQLPQNVIYKGNPTNNLVILLTNTKKNIASGMGSRKEAYDIIKEKDMADAIKEAYGINYTHISTSDLWMFINDELEGYSENGEEPEEEDEEDDVTEDCPNEEDEEDEEDTEKEYTLDEYIKDLSESIDDAEDTIILHVAQLVKEKVLVAPDLQAMQDDLDILKLLVLGKKEQPKSEPVSTSDGSINDNDIDGMINDLYI